ncbi:MAG TPA: hypothetical protein VIB07_06510 [Nitrososphaera sp.]|jgi:hypothetical protein
MLTIAFFALGGLIASAAIFQQFTIASKPYAISQEEAVRIALNQVSLEPNREAQILPHAIAKATLIHIGKDGWSFLVDENTLADTWAFRKDAGFEKYEEEYAWYAEVTTSNVNGGSREYWYLIDIDSGRAIGNGSDAMKSSTVSR